MSRGTRRRPPDPGYSAVAASPGADKDSGAGAAGVGTVAVFAAVAAYVL